MYQVRLDCGNGFTLDQNGKGFILFRCYQVSKPRAFGQLWRRFGRQMHLIRGDWKATARTV